MRKYKTIVEVYDGRRTILVTQAIGDTDNLSLIANDSRTGVHWESKGLNLYDLGNQLDTLSLVESGYNDIVNDTIRKINKSSHPDALCGVLWDVQQRRAFRELKRVLVEVFKPISELITKLSKMLSNDKKDGK